jgi:hypothetical protein
VAVWSGLKKFPVCEVELTFGGATHPDAATTRSIVIQQIIRAIISFIINISAIHSYKVCLVGLPPIRKFQVKDNPSGLKASHKSVILSHHDTVI